MEHIVVVSGPSGVGKGSLIRGLLSRMDGARVTVSETTRPSRGGEKEGADYTFVSTEVFKGRIEDGCYVEWEFFYDTYYGTPKSELEERDEGEWVLLELDPKGGLSIKRVFPAATLVFVLPGSIDQLMRQLERRGTESEEQRGLRSKRIFEELSMADQFEYAVVNKDLDESIDDFCELVGSLRFKLSNNIDVIENLKKDARDFAYGV